jgi:hypothetical protein
VPGAEHRAADRPHREGVAERDHQQAGGLGELPAGDQPLAADPVGERAGEQLPDAPHGRGDGDQQPDGAEVEPAEGEEHREQPPGHALVEVVDQPRLAGRRQGPVAPGREREHLPLRSGRRRGRRWVADDVVGDLVGDVAGGLAHEHAGEPEPERGEREPEEERGGAQPAVSAIAPVAQAATATAP